MFRSLYEDSGYRRRVVSWNGADVWGDAGLLQHGTVLAAEPDGLVVDFGCEGQRRQLVKYGQAFSYCGTWCYEMRMRPGDAVQVLLRQNARSPWAWHPGTLLTPAILERGTRALALVDVQLGDIGRREVVAYQQIRLPQSPTALPSRALQQRDFVVISVRQLPTHVTQMLSTPLLWKVFCQSVSRTNSVWPVSVNGGSLLLLQLSDDAYRSSQLKGIIEETWEYIDTEMKKDALGGKGWRCRLSSAGAAVETGLCAENGWEHTGRILQDVHAIVLVEMLTYMDTVERAAQRRVCRVFDGLIRRTFSTEIRLTYRECGLGRETVCEGCSSFVQSYPLHAPLLKCVTSSTRRITLTNGAPGSLLEILRTVEMCRQLGQCAAGQQVVVVARQCEVDVKDAEWFEAAMAGGWWQQLLFKGCTMPSRFLRISFSGSLRCSSPQEDLYQVVERQLPSVDVQRTSEWVARTLKGRSFDRRRIQLVLGDFVEVEPPADAPRFVIRPINEWSEDDLATLDVSKLPRLVQYVLSRIMPPEFSVAEEEGDHEEDAGEESSDGEAIFCASSPSSSLSSPSSSPSSSASSLHSSLSSSSFSSDSSLRHSCLTSASLAGLSSSSSSSDSAERGDKVAGSPLRGRKRKASEEEGHE